MIVDKLYYVAGTGPNGEKMLAEANINIVREWATHQRTGYATDGYVLVMQHQLLNVANAVASLKAL